MTVGVAVKVYDGIVLAADSATTLSLANGSHQVYNNANKIIQLHRSKPVALMTWGLGNIGSASIATLGKDLRQRLMGQDLDHPDWELEENYSVEAVANRVIEMFHALYATVGHSLPPPNPLGQLGILVAGYSSDSRLAEAWEITIEDLDASPAPKVIFDLERCGWQTFAQPYPTQRLIDGYDPRILDNLRNDLTPTEYAKVENLLVNHYTGLREVYVVPSMPLVDAIDFARYLVDVTVGYRHYALGPDTVGGPVEVAAMTRHEGFKWISRKHHFSAELNPEVRRP